MAVIERPPAVLLVPLNPGSPFVGRASRPVMVEMSVRIASPAVASGVERALGGGRVSGSAGVADHDRNQAAVAAVTNGRLDADLGRDADDRKGSDLGVAQREVERGALERGHRELVEDRLRLARSELGQELKTGESRRNGETISST